MGAPEKDNFDFSTAYITLQNFSKWPMDMALSDDAGKDKLAVSLTTANARDTVAWSIATNCRIPQEELSVRWLTSPGISGLTERLRPEDIAFWLAAVHPSHDQGTEGLGTLSFEQAAAVLDGEEASRLVRFVHIEDRNSYLAAHAGVRLLLGSIVGHAADTLRFRPSEHGKPMLVSDSPNIDFSLSHARGVVAVAAARSPVGVDVEPLREIPDLDSVSEIVLAREEREVLWSTPAAFRSRLFLRYWTLKEAILKAAALGFIIPPHSVIIDAGPSPAVLSLPAALGPVSQWRLIAPAA
ncbi:4'-phosphopantetheinyl transferase superfamily protein [Bradyrhizobium sp. AUGA SZCCT0042]|uniref:4'-phosphopantetheinyl transferase family protein n=1 Tax=Bradyrhizobium sp. AUGA SZCCT0042 TaxID=2807651 RepID=UPI001BA6EF1A|nr:4'-phosphopantetheinyl transferase superfamily protein [Bradyrhizobium sp. AUGA SZCCT0042]MBR1296057.1 4'-phosphopantetheinyl transferase superfamily protein [Bradyrhizobium sp. AUGA SZCCT0042]